MLFGRHTGGEAIEPFFNNHATEGEPRSVRIQDSVSVRVVVVGVVSMIMWERRRTVGVEELE